MKYIEGRWNIATNAENNRGKIQALSLAKECYSMKLELLTNATVVDDAIRFVAERNKAYLITNENKLDMIGNELEPTITNQIF